jgi:hypothetical protein
VHHAISGDQDVARLQVAMDHEVLMRVLDGSADVHEEAKPGGDAELIPIAVRRDWQTVDVFHDQVRVAVVGHASVEESCDMRMDQPGKDAALGHEPLVQRIVRIAGGDHFDGDPLLKVPFDSICQIHRPHAAAPELGHDPVGAYTYRRLRLDQLGDRCDVW